MALTPAERAKRCREKRKQNVQRDAEHKSRIQIRNARYYKEARKDPKNLERLQKKWTAASAKYRNKKKLVQCQDTPPNSPTGDTPPSRGRVLRRNRERERTLLAKEMEKTATAERKADMWRKRFKRLEAKKTASGSPNTKAQEAAKELPESVKPKIRRQLFEAELLKEGIKEVYMNATTGQRKTLSLICSSSVVKKYKCLTPVSSLLGLHARKRASKSKVKSINKIKRAVEAFFVRDDVSHLTAGKKETKTKHKARVQKRILSDTMKNLHLLYLKSHSKISYSMFARCKPFYVVSPQVERRETCRCRIHENFYLMFSKLKQLGLLIPDDERTIVQLSINNVLINPGDQGDDTVFWWSWELSTKHYIKDGIKKEAKTIGKVRKTGTVNDLVEAFKHMCPHYKKHVNNKCAQEKAYYACKEIVHESDYDCLLICDFSQNYNCKLAAEVQSFHFGGSREQVSLHTSVLYAGGNIESFCTVSDHLDHSPAAIWAHMDPVLKYIREKYRYITTIHFFTDGPSTQYRQKKNFYLYGNKFKDYKFYASTWSYFEAGHGKGPADGIGGAVKRLADRIVAHGSDVSSAKEFFSKVSQEESKVHFFFITKESIEAVEQCIPKNLKTVKGTQNIHQVVPKCGNEMFHRELSCFCPQNKWIRNIFCSHHKMKSSEILPALIDEPRDVTMIDQREDSEIQELQINGEGSGVLNTKETQKVNKKDLGMQINEVNRQLKAGDHVLVKLGKFTYAAVMQEDMTDEALVTYFKQCKKTKYFLVDDNDSSYIKEEQVVQLLPEPLIIKKGNRLYYDFGDLVVREK